MVAFPAVCKLDMVDVCTLVVCRSCLSYWHTYFSFCSLKFWVICELGCPKNHSIVINVLLPRLLSNCLAALQLTPRYWVYGAWRLLNQLILFEGCWLRYSSIIHSLFKHSWIRLHCKIFIVFYVHLEGGHVSHNKHKGMHRRQLDSLLNKKIVD